MIVNPGTSLRMFAFYTYGGTGKSTLTDVVADVKESGTYKDTLDAVNEGDGWYHIDWTATTRCYPQATFKTAEPQVDQKHIPALGFTLIELQNDYDNFAATGFIIVGQGRGSVTWNDTVTDGVNPVEHVVVKAYAKSGATVNWTEIVAMDVTNHLGEYTLYLDPGTYVLSVERKNVQIATMEITVS